MANEIQVLEPSPELKNTLAACEAWAAAIVIQSQVQRAEVMDKVRQIKAARAAAVEYFRDDKEKAHALHKSITAKEKFFTDHYDAAEKIAKDKVLAFDAVENAKRAAEERRLQALADEAARKERERLEKEASKLKTPELREARLEAAAAVQAPVVTISAPEKAKGESTRTAWKAKLADLKALASAAAAGNDVALSLLEFDQSAANKFASATKGAVAIPGIEFYEEAVLAVGR